MEESNWIEEKFSDIESRVKELETFCANLDEEEDEGVDEPAAPAVRWEVDFTGVVRGTVVILLSISAMIIATTALVRSWK